MVVSSGQTVHWLQRALILCALSLLGTTARGQGTWEDAWRPPHFASDYGSSVDVSRYPRPPYRVIQSGGPNEVLPLPLEYVTEPGLLSRIQLDLIGDLRYSVFNFTDLKIPYSGLDGFGVAKFSGWVDAERSYGPYVSLVPVITSENEFFFQRYVEVRAGAQWYPFSDRDNIGPYQQYVRPIRLFGFFGNRIYYNERFDDLIEDDFQAGADYFYDNLFADSDKYVAIFMNATYRQTNFSEIFNSDNDYQAFLWSGNIKLGPKFRHENSFIIPYAVIDWTYVPKYRDRFFENFLRVGAGIRWHPKTDEAGGLFFDFLRRFHVFAEVVNNVAWLGKSPARELRDTDFRVGLQFATGGIFRQ